MSAEESLVHSITRSRTESHPIRSSPMPSPGVGGWVEPGGSSELELHFLIHLQQRGHGQAGPCPLRWVPEVLWAPGRAPEGPEESPLPSGPGHPRWLAHRLLVPSLRAGRPPARPPAAILRPRVCAPSLSWSARDPLSVNLSSPRGAISTPTR